MKSHFSNFDHARHSRRGSALLVILVLLSLMVVIISVNTASVNRLAREEKAVEKRQIQRLNPSAKSQARPVPSATNLPPAK